MLHDAISIISDSFRRDIETVHVESVIMAVTHSQRGIRYWNVIRPIGRLKCVVDGIAQGRSARGDNLNVDFRLIILA